MRGAELPPEGPRGDVRVRLVGLDAEDGVRGCLLGVPQPRQTVPWSSDRVREVEVGMVEEASTGTREEAVHCVGAAAEHRVARGRVRVGSTGEHEERDGQRANDTSGGELEVMGRLLAGARPTCGIASRPALKT